MARDDKEDRSLAAMPLFVSPRNCLAVLGMQPREFREFIRSEGLTIIERGKNRLVRVTEIVDRLEAKAKPLKNVETNRERLRKVAGLGGAK